MSTFIKNIGLYGFGVVGQGFYNFISKEGSIDRIPTVVVKSKSKKRDNTKINFTTDGNSLLLDKESTVIVEAINNEEEAFEIVSTALKYGKQVVSASKKLIANRLEELLELERKHGGSLLYEAAVAGSIPIVRVLNDFYQQEEITAISGILNGSSNFILSKLFNEGISYELALAQAQSNGFAELNPASDVEGYDALYKLILLTKHGFGKNVTSNKILRIGIQNILPEDIKLAKKYSFKIKQVASVKLIDGKLDLSVVPLLVDSASELFSLEQEYNAVEIKSKTIGTQFYKGKGAGSAPTGASVFADVKAIEKGYKYVYKSGDSKAINNDIVYELLVRVPDGYEKETLPFKTKLLTSVAENLLFVKASKAELINNQELIAKLKLSLLFFDNEDVRGKIISRIKAVKPQEL